MAEKLNFDAALKRFTSATKQSMKYALECAELSLRHFAEHGDVSQCQAFLDAMPKNFIRRAAYLKWLAAHSPITMTDKKLHKDKSENAVKLDVDGALKKPFWDFAPDKEVVVFTADDPIKAIMVLLKKYENPERTKPADAEAEATVKRIKIALNAIQPPVAGATAQAA